MLFGDELGQVLEVAQVDRVDRVQRLSRCVDEDHRRGRVLARERIHPDLLVRGHGGSGVAVGRPEGAQGQPGAVGLWRHDEVAIRHVGVLAGREQEVRAAGAAIGTGGADILDLAHPHVVEDPEHTGRHLDHRRPVGVERQEPQPVDRLRLGVSSNDLASNGPSQVM